MSQLNLMRALKYDTGDLRANREGYISDAQRERFEPPKTNRLVVAVVLGHLGLVGGLLLVLALYTGSLTVWAIFVVVSLLTLAPFGWMQDINRVRPVVRNDVSRGKVASASGILILKEKRGRTPHFDLLVDGVALQITPAEAAAFQNEETYCVYYLPESRTLLSAESID